MCIFATHDMQLRAVKESEMLKSQLQRVTRENKELWLQQESSIRSIKDHLDTIYELRQEVHQYELAVNALKTSTEDDQSRADSKLQSEARVADQVCVHVHVRV